MSLFMTTAAFRESDPTESRGGPPNKSSQEKVSVLNRRACGWRTENLFEALSVLLFPTGLNFSSKYDAQAVFV